MCVAVVASVGTLVTILTMEGTQRDVIVDSYIVRQTRTTNEPTVLLQVMPMPHVWLPSHSSRSLHSKLYGKEAFTLFDVSIVPLFTPVESV